MKRITVNVLCLLVDSDGFPVNAHGEPISGNQKPVYEWDKRRVSINRFCPDDMAKPKRRTVQYVDQKTAKAKRCKCHGKVRLIGLGR
jgi:hypothetical protein